MTSWHRYAHLMSKQAFSISDEHSEDFIMNDESKVKGKVHPRTGTEALYRPYGP